jgi:RNA polymerase sigma-70 factor (sigma-E family)
VRLIEVRRQPDPRQQEAVEFCRVLHPRLVGTLAFHLGSVDVAEELAQEALVRVWERWHSVRGMEAPQAWAYRVALNLATSRFRRRAAERKAYQRLAQTAEEHTAPDPAVVLAVREALRSLPERQRAAVVLRYFADLSVADTASALRCQPGTVKALTSQGIARLRRDFEVSTAEEEPEHA